MSDLYLMKKVVILKNIQVTVKTFFPPFSTISVWARTENMCGNDNHEKETKQIYTLGAYLLHIRIGNLNWCISRHCKNEAREIDCICCREIDGCNAY